MTGTPASSPIEFADAQACFQRRACCVVTAKKIPLCHALGRVLAEDIVAIRDVPAFDNAAVDGIAFCWSEAITPGVRLALCDGRSAAGHAFANSVPAGHAVRILTGAPIPPGTDTVLPSESCTFNGDQVMLRLSVRRGANCRSAGEDVAAKSRIVQRNTRLGPWEIAAAASAGFGELPAYRPLRVALFSTGDELIEPGMPWRESGVFDANRPMLTALIADLPVELVDLGIIVDQRGKVHEVLERCAQHDVAIASGGASRGEEDHVARLLSERGSLDFWRVNIRPGRPLALGQWGRATVVALPGNPVAAALCFLRLVRPMLLGKAGATWMVPTGCLMPAAARIDKNAGRTELIRCRVEQSPTGDRVRPVVRQGSGMLSTLLEADGIVELRSQSPAIDVDELVPFISWHELGVELSTLGR